MSKEEELEYVLNTEWHELSDWDKAIEKLSDGPLWRMISCCEHHGIDYEHYIEITYDYEFPDPEMLEWEVI